MTRDACAGDREARQRALREAWRSKQQKERQEAEEARRKAKEATDLEEALQKRREKASRMRIVRFICSLIHTHLAGGEGKEGARRAGERDGGRRPRGEGRLAAKARVTCDNPTKEGSAIGSIA
eukprot:scaffold735_cov255-Pinguiococcus_pyrenoidosus.AAC.17